ncbi:MAG: DUF4189 domain-containing protein [Reyranella sp.]|uniref:DUF4189 domain-containing protein n=1 Tax=Reyranella sp. TaxID=1929291 RepID=UPI0011F68FFA|nr:DUF4189 domain-containing protein [Reyranella sp.]TAJ85560.1 MAG: DUF4189 domain-containing protein [Reyranella sp.]TBR29487.1 MAG: DUF4189 domain-containing protein [Reyranella sp.]
MMKRLTILLATFLATTAAIVATAQAQEVWGAVATDNERLFGVSAGMATREAAETSALAECGPLECRIRMSAPQRCIAYAHSDNGQASGYGAAPTRQDAEQSAWNECNARVPSNSCTIRSARCFE